MTPTITSGIGASSDYWAKHDRQKGLAYSEGYQKIYDAFYGGDAIKIDVDGSNFNIINGRHRIWLGQTTGRCDFANASDEKGYQELGDKRDARTTRTLRISTSRSGITS